MDAKNKLITTFDVINDSPDQGQLFSMSIKTKDVYEVEELSVLADKGYYCSEDIDKCEKEKIITYVSKPVYSNGIGDSRYFIDKFKYDEDNNTYICPEGEVLFCKTKKPDAKDIEYRNKEACSKCLNREKCTNAKGGKIIQKDRYNLAVEHMVNRIKSEEKLYSQRKCIVEHPFGTLKRAMGFYHLLLSGFKIVSDNVSIAFFTYNLIRVINILGN